MFKHIVDNEVELKLLDIIHAEELFSLTNSCRQYLREWLPWVDGSRTIEDTKSFIQLTKQQFVANNGCQAGIWYNGSLAGVIGYHGLNGMSKHTSIGYWLGQKYQGHGIMTKACRAFVNYALADLQLNRVEIRCAEKNYRSRAIPERLGFMMEGTIREAEWLCDHYVDHVVYGMLAKDWCME